MNKRFLTVLLTLCMLLSIFSASAFAATITVNENGTKTEGNDLPYTTAGIDVTAQAVNEDAKNKAVYEVELVWGDMHFAWGIHDQVNSNGNEDYALIWNPETHQYDPNSEVLSAEKEWYLISEDALENEADIDALQSDILIFNHSNAAVNTTVTLADTADDYDTELSTKGTGYANSSASSTAVAEGTANSNYGGYTQEFELPKAVLNTPYDATTTAMLTVMPTKEVVDGALVDETTIATITVELAEAPEVVEGTDTITKTIKLTEDNQYDAVWSIVTTEPKTNP